MAADIDALAIRIVRAIETPLDGSSANPDVLDVHRRYCEAKAIRPSLDGGWSECSERARASFVADLLAPLYAALRDMIVVCRICGGLGVVDSRLAGTKPCQRCGPARALLGVN